MESKIRCRQCVSLQFLVEHLFLHDCSTTPLVRDKPRTRSMRPWSFLRLHGGNEGSWDDELSPPHLWQGQLRLQNPRVLSVRAASPATNQLLQSAKIKTFLSEQILVFRGTEFRQQYVLVNHNVIWFVFVLSVKKFGKTSFRTQKRGWSCSGSPPPRPWKKTKTYLGLHVQAVNPARTNEQKVKGPVFSLAGKYHRCLGDSLCIDSWLECYKLKPAQRISWHLVNQLFCRFRGWELLKGQLRFRRGRPTPTENLTQQN